MQIHCIYKWPDCISQLGRHCKQARRQPRPTQPQPCTPQQPHAPPPLVMLRQPRHAATRSISSHKQLFQISTLWQLLPPPMGLPYWSWQASSWYVQGRSRRAKVIWASRYKIFCCCFFLLLEIPWPGPNQRPLRGGAAPSHRSGLRPLEGNFERLKVTLKPLKENV